MGFRQVGEPRSAAEWAQLHSGIEFILPEREREIMQLSAYGKYRIEDLAHMFDMPEHEIRKSLARTARTLTTWERNACKWASRFVAREPWAEDGRSWRPGDAKTPERP